MLDVGVTVKTGMRRGGIAVRGSWRRFPLLHAEVFADVSAHRPIRIIAVQRIDRHDDAERLLTA